jgi:hypothetical protein
MHHHFEQCQGRNLYVSEEMRAEIQTKFKMTLSVYNWKISEGI